MVQSGGPDLKQARRTGLSGRRARRTKSRGPKSLSYSFLIITMLSECSDASPGSPCTNLEADDCKYESNADTDLCCCCSDPLDWKSLLCLPDSTSEDDMTWQPKMTNCPAESCGIEGEWLWEKTSDPSFHRCGHLAELSWLLSLQPWQNIYDSSRARRDLVIAIQCFWRFV